VSEISSLHDYVPGSPGGVPKFPPGTSVSELEVRQNELYLAMRVVEEMPPSEAQTACIVKLAERMRRLVELLGKSEVGRYLDV
jgi:hypothetical protein